MNTFKMGEQPITMPVNFSAMKRLAEQAVDPLKVSMMAHLSGESFCPTTEEVILILWVGYTESGADEYKSIDEFANALIKQGIIELFGVAVEYLMAFVVGEPSKPVRRTKKKSVKKKTTPQ